MTKYEFLVALSESLKGLSEKDKIQYMEYYSEMIDDRIEEGLSEAEAVADVGTIDEISAQIFEEVTQSKSSNNSKRKLKTWEIVLLAIGSPLWFSLLVAAFSVIISLFAVLFSAIVSLYAGTLTLGALGIASIPMLIIMICKGNVAGGLILAGAGLICAGLSIFMFIGTNKLVKFILKLCKKIISLIKKRFKGNN